MPQLKEYTSRAEVVGPVDTKRATAEDFGSSVGKSIQVLGAQVERTMDAFEKRDEQEEVSALQAKIADVHSKKSVELREQVQQGTLNAEEYQQKLDEELGAIGNEISTTAGQKYFRVASAQMKGHFFESTAAAASDLAGVRAKTNYLNSLNTQSSALINDPSGYDFARNLHDQGLDEQVKTGLLPFEAAEQLKLEGQRVLARDAVKGWIKLNPEAAKEQLNKGQWDDKITGDMKDQLFGEADTAIRAKEYDRERQEREREKAIKLRQEATQNDFLKKMQEGKLSGEDILNSNLEAFGSGSKNQFLDMLKSSAEKKITTDPGVYLDLWERVHLPDGDPKKIIDENELNGYVGKGLTFDTLNQLRGEMQGKRTEEGMIEAEWKKGVLDQARGSLTKSNAMLGIKDPQGDENMQRFMVFFNKRYQELRRQGKKPEELLNPDSPEYLGKFIRNYVRTPQQIMKDMSKGMRIDLIPDGTYKGPYAPGQTPASAPAVTVDPEAARKPGESAADYLKRRKK